MSIRICIPWCLRTMRIHKKKIFINDKFKIIELSRGFILISLIFVYIIKFKVQFITNNSHVLNRAGHIVTKNMK